MNVVKNESTIFIDVDSTLIFSRDPARPLNGRTVQVYDAVAETYITMIEHTPMVRLLKEEHHRGAHIVVWSKGGYEWATNVLKALDLTNFVHQVMTKPKTYFDDLPIEEWLKDRVYFPPNKLYKE